MDVDENNLYAIENELSGKMDTNYTQTQVQTLQQKHIK